MATDVDIANLALSNIGHAPDLVTSLASTDTTSKLLNLHYPIARDALLNEHNWNFAIKRVALALNATEPVFEFTYAYNLPSDYLRVIRTNLDFEDAVALSSNKWRVEGSTLLSNTGPGDKLTITAATQANPVVLTAVSSNLSDGVSVFVEDVAGMTELNDIAYTVDNPTTDTLELKGIDGSAFTAYTSGGTVRQLNIEIEYVSQITTTTEFTQTFVDLLAFNLSARIAPRLTDNANIANSMWDVYNRKLELARNRDAVEGTPRDITAELWINSRA